MFETTFEAAMAMIAEAYACWGEDGCIACFVKREDGFGYNYGERHPDKDQDEVTGVISLEDNQKVRYHNGSIWFWVRTDSYDEPNQLIEHQVTVTGPVNLHDSLRLHWDVIAGFPVDDWKEQVRNGDTRLGYFDWVNNAINNGNREPA